MWLLTLAITLTLAPPPQAQVPSPTEGDFVIRNFTFTSGESLPELRMHYRTYGTPRRDAQGIVRNAVLIMHGTGGTGGQFSGRGFAGELFGPGQPLAATRYFIILPDDIGHGRSSKPSDGLRAAFPRYGYVDMVTAEHRLVREGLGVSHLRLVMGTSMGGMHTWMWGEMYPDFMDALMPLASLPTQIAGRNRAWRRVVIDAIRSDPDWKNGDYTTQPRSLRTAAQMLWLVGSNPIRRQTEAPTLQDADRVLDAYVANYLKTGDANDILYALEASRDYDPGPALEKITAPLVAINSADDIINPPELRILETQITRVPNGRAIVLPLSERTAGHGTHTLAALWKEHLVALLADTEGTIRVTDAAHVQFWTNLRALCGGAFEGTVIEAPPSDTTFAGKRLVMRVGPCSADEIRIPFHVGDDRSRTWVITRTAGGLRLKHDHRHENGTEDKVSRYGGDARRAGRATRQEFPADAHTIGVIPEARTNVWTIEIEPGKTFVYALRREGTDRRFRIEFDTTRRVEKP
ncbi:MAG TPA: alpha/beta fold hydrolase [Vicinamibacterales bacterium]|nr:alpha/beta fold hydrolase [Vicinamibacterales bacterium]